MPPKPQHKDIRAYALDILARIENGMAYSNVLLSHAAKDPTIGKAQFPLLERLVKGTLEQRLVIEAALDAHLPKGLSSLPSPVQDILRLGAYQVLFLDNIPKQVSVDVMVEICKKSKLSGFTKLTNAVLRRVAQNQVPKPVAADQKSATDLSTAYSHPLWLTEIYVRKLGIEEAAVLCKANNNPAPLCVRTNVLKISRAELMGKFASEGIETTVTKFSPECLLLTKLPSAKRLHELEAISDGLCIIQDEASALVSLLLNPQPGEFVVDLCSAPGGKTTHIASLMQNQGRVLAVESNESKLALVLDNCERLGVRIVETAHADGRSLGLHHPADRILVDAPCSALGIVGKRADVRWSKEPAQFEPLAVLQAELLHAAANLLRLGGRIVYSTCTITDEENEQIIDRFLETHQDFVLVPASAHLAAELITPRGFLRTWPQRHGMAGGFAAAVERRS